MTVPTREREGGGTDPRGRPFGGYEIREFRVAERNYCTNNIQLSRSVSNVQ